MNLVKLNIDIDEKWPIFSLDSPENPNGPWVVDVDDDFYRQYCANFRKFQEIQINLQRIYAKQRRIIAEESCGYRIQKSGEIDAEFKSNRIASLPS